VGVLVGVEVGPDSIGVGVFVGFGVGVLVIVGVGVIVCVGVGVEKSSIISFPADVASGTVFSDDVCNRGITAAAEVPRIIVIISAIGSGIAFVKYTS
jgi:hypothetical protein